MRVCLVGLVVLAALAQAPHARAAGPGVGECLSATETSLKLRADHKLRSARAALLVCSSASCPVDVRQECIRRMDAVNAAVPSVVFAVRTDAGKELSDVKVTMDDEVVAEHLEGSALSLDPGSHRFTFEAAGLPPATETLILHEGEKNRREVVVLGAPAAPPPAVGVPAASLAAAPPAPDSSAPSAVDRGHGRRVAGLAVGGAGVVGVALGSVFGGLTFSSWSSANSECPTHAGCSTQAINHRSDAVTDGAVSTVAFVAGGILLATGLTLYFTAPRDHAPQLGLQIAPGGAGLTGTFP
jgi:hypothetical protein